MLKSEKSIKKRKESKLTPINSNKGNIKQLKINISGPNNLSKSKTKEQKLKTSRNQSGSKLKKSIDQNNSLSKMAIIKSKTSKLQSEISDLNSKISKITNDTIILSNDYKNKLLSLDNDIQKYSKQYKLLYNKLTKFGNDFNDKIKNMNVNKMIAKKQSHNNITDINKEIELKEEMIKNNNKLIQDLEKNIKRYSKTIQETPEDKIDILNTELEQIIKIESAMTEEINSLQKMKNAHNKNCAKQTSNLLKEFDKLQIEYNYEIKKNSANEDNNISKDTPIDTEKTNQQNSENNTNNNGDKNSNSYIFRINKEGSVNKKKKFKLLSVKLSNNNNLNNNIIKINNSYDNKNNLSIVRNRINKLGESIIFKKLKGMDNQNLDDKFLFSAEEKENLEKYIPEQYLKTCEGVYNEQKNLTANIVTEKYKENLDKKKKLIQITTNKINETDGKSKKMTEDRAILNYKISTIKKQKAETNEKIKKYENENKRISKKYNDIMANNKKLKKEFLEFCNKIKEGDLIIKKGVSLNKQNLEAIKKWGDENKNYDENSNNKKNKVD